MSLEQEVEVNFVKAEMLCQRVVGFVKAEMLCQLVAGNLLFGASVDLCLSEMLPETKLDHH